MALDILALGEDTRALMEATGRYHEPVAAALHEYGIRVTVLNPLFIKQSGGGSIRKVKTDKADAMKIAKNALDNWVDLREYTPMEAIREQLKLCSRQYNLYMKNVVALQNNLISLTDKVFPGVNELFSSPDRADGSQKWIDFVITFWHCECICLVSEAAFTQRYRKWCKRKGYHFSERKATELYMGSMGHITTLPRNSNTKLLITTAAKELASAKATLAVLRAEMNRLAQQLPEYETVRAMYGVGETTAVQLMAEIGDVRRVPPAAVPSWALPALIRRWMTLENTSPRAIPQRSGALLTCARHCTRSSAPISARPPLTSRCTSSWTRSGPRANPISST